MEIDNTPAKPKAFERIPLGRTEAEKLDVWLKQINESTSGFLSLTKTDIVNFLIREHKAELALKEMARLRQDHYDPFRHIDWITQALRVALASGDTGMVARLQEEVRGIELSVVAHAKDAVDAGVLGLPSPPPLRPRRKRTNKQSDKDAAESATEPAAQPVRTTDISS